MTDDNLEPAPRINVGKQSEVIARNEREHDRIWNAAIEAAAILTHNRGSRQCMSAAIEIRKLKK